jgi:hypothetical protein
LILYCYVDPPVWYPGKAIGDGDNIMVIIVIETEYVEVVGIEVVAKLVCEIRISSCGFWGWYGGGGVGGGCEWIGYRSG